MFKRTVISSFHQSSNPGAHPGFILRFSAMHVQWEETFTSTTRRQSRDDMPASLSKVLIGIESTCMFIEMSLCTYI